jgi:hypothetical protein
MPCVVSHNHRSYVVGKFAEQGLKHVSAVMGADSGCRLTCVSTQLEANYPVVKVHQVPKLFCRFGSSKPPL